MIGPIYYEKGTEAWRLMTTHQTTAPGLEWQPQFCSWPASSVPFSASVSTGRRALPSRKHWVLCPFPTPTAGLDTQKMLTPGQKLAY